MLNEEDQILIEKSTEDEIFYCKEDICRYHHTKRVKKILTEVDTDLVAKIHRSFNSKVNNKIWSIGEFTKYIMNVTLDNEWYF